MINQEMSGQIAKRSGRHRGLSRRQHAFVREKILGLNDKEAALAAGYSLSIAENTKQKIWAKPQVQAEFERLKRRYPVIRTSGEETGE